VDKVLVTMQKDDLNNITCFFGVAASLKLALPLYKASE
jgi:hypothetical protein